MARRRKKERFSSHRRTSEIKKADSTGKPRSIQVEVRKKRVLVRSDLSDKVAAVGPETGAVPCAGSSVDRPGPGCRATGIASGGSKKTS